jgi:glutathione S-transferase
MLELYYFPTATCGYKARLTLAEKGVDYVHRVLNRDAGDLSTPEYLSLNPNAVVPTLVHNGQVLIESSIIMVYIDEAFEGQMLRTNQALERARCAEWLKRADDIYLPALGAVTYGIFRRRDVMQKSSKELAAYYAAIPDAKRRAQRQSVVELGIQSIEVTNGLLALRTMLDDLENALSQTPFLTGVIYGLADAALTPFVSRLAELKFEWMWAHLPCLSAWWNRVQERASFETVFAAYPNPERKLGMQQAGEEAREEAIRILAIK